MPPKRSRAKALETPTMTDTIRRSSRTRSGAKIQYTSKMLSIDACTSPIQTPRTTRRRAAATGDDHNLPTSKKAKIATTADLPTSGIRGVAEKKPKIREIGKGSRRQVMIAAPREALDVLVFGSGECGELGLGPTEPSALRPVINPYVSCSKSSGFQVVQLACGGMHTLALTACNEIVTWGVNDNGALGRDTKWEGAYRDADPDSSYEEDEDDLNPLESTPTAVKADCFPQDTRFVQVAAGDSCSFALTDQGLVYGWGTFRDANGNDGFLRETNGITIEKQLTPILIPGLRSIKQLACGANHALALDAKGIVWGWGTGEQNQLGRRLLPRHRDNLRPRRVEVCRGRAVYIGSGEYHSFAIDANDDVWAWGLNSFGEAGIAEMVRDDSSVLPYPTKIPDLCGEGILVIDGGAHHSAAVTGDGRCLVWGRIDYGQLGIKFSPKQLRDESLIRCDERSQPRICMRPTEVPNVGQAAFAACGTDHTLILNTDGSAFATGFGSMGQLGLGAEDDVTVAKRIQGKTMEGRRVIWADAGGQFSILAGPPP